METSGGGAESLYVFQVLAGEAGSRKRKGIGFQLKFWKKWSYLIMMAAAGFLYLSCVDSWQVYARPLERVKAFCMEIVGKNGEEAPAETPVPEDAPVGEVSGNGENVGVSDGDAEEAEQFVSETGQSDSEAGQTDGDTSLTGGEPSEPIFTTVEDDYFADAVFIGDSRTVGMYEYGGLENVSTFYASTGLTVYKLFDSAIVQVPGQKKKITVDEALQQNSFAKIYLMIGINEMGTGTVETFTEKYREVLEHLQELQPDAIIYIQGIMKVTTERSNQGDYINNEGIIARNEELEKLADNRKIFYLDVNPLICDETGGMVESYTFDGVHLKAQYIQIWKDFLKRHAIQ